MDKVLDHLRNHRATPDGRLVAIGEHAHADDADAALRLDRRNRIVVKNFGSAVDAEHEPHARAIDVGIQDSHSGTREAERHCEVRCHSGLAHAALAARNRDHMRHFTDVGNLRSLRCRIGAFHAALRRKRYVHLACAKALDDGNALVLELVTDGACRSREPQVEAHLVALYLQVLDKVQFHDVLVQVRILDRTQGT